MMTTSTIGFGIRRSLRVVAVPIAMLLLSLTLTACGDKEEAPAPAHEVQLAEARKATESEMAARRVAEDRLGTVLWLAVLVAGGALALGLAVGSSSGKRREVARPNPSPATSLQVGDGSANE